VVLRQFVESGDEPVQKRDGFFGAEPTRQTHKPADVREQDGRREITGMLLSYEDGQIAVREDDGTVFSAAKAQTAFVRLQDKAPPHSPGYEHNEGEER
jgi:hypothetical protein